MKKTIRILAVLLALVMVLPAFGCLVQQDKPETASENTPSAAPDESEPPESKGDRNAVAVTLGDLTITAGEIEDAYDSYMQMYSYYGMTAPTDDASIHEYTQTVVEGLLAQKVPLWKAQQLGVELSPEELSKVDEQAHADADAEYSDIVLSYASYFTDAGQVENVSDLSEEQLSETLEHLNADVREYYGDSESDLEVYIADRYDDFYEEHLITALADKLQAQNDETVTVTDEDVEKWYADQLADQKESFDADPTEYRFQREGVGLDSDAAPLLYVPAGLAAIRLIKLAPEGEVPAEIAENEKKLAELEAEYGKLVLNKGDEARIGEIETEYADLLAATESVKTGYYGTVSEQANALYARLTAGEDFAAVAASVSEDAAAEQIIWLDGEDPDYPEAVRTAIAALDEGAYTAVLQDGDAFYLAELIGRLTPGELDRAPIEAKIREAAAKALRSAAWDELLAAWEDEAKLAATYREEAYAYVGH